AGCDAAAAGGSGAGSDNCDGPDYCRVRLVRAVQLECMGDYTDPGRASGGGQMDGHPEHLREHLRYHCALRYRLDRKGDPLLFLGLRTSSRDVTNGRRFFPFRGSEVNSDQMGKLIRVCYLQPAHKLRLVLG